MEQQATSSSAMAKPPLSPRRTLSTPIAVSPKIRSPIFPTISRSLTPMPKPASPPPPRVEIVSDVSQRRSALQRLGQRPDHEKVDAARCKLREVESHLSKKLHEIVLSPRPENQDRLEWRNRLAEREKECREATEKQVSAYRALVLLDEMHEAYGRSLREAEERLVKVYESAFDKIAASSDATEIIMDVEVVDSLRDALRKSGFERVDLSGRRLRVLQENVFGSIRRVVWLNLSGNLLEDIPESIAGLDSLEELNISSNLLSSLSESVGLFRKLRVLNVSGNKLNALPDSISHCRCLVELDVSFNNLTYLPTNIGYELSNLQVLFIQYNKIRSLPTSVCEMRSLCHLDAHFNELHGLPPAIGKLKNLEILNLSSNFSDLTELPDSIGDLTELRELDLGSNQIQVLPSTFGRLHNLIKLNIDQNPLVIPPMEVVNQGIEAVRTFMAKRWRVELEEEAPYCRRAAGTNWIVDTQHLLVESFCYRCFQECFRGPGHNSNWRKREISLIIKDESKLSQINCKEPTPTRLSPFITRNSGIRN